jgi:HEAT repeat protein
MKTRLFGVALSIFLGLASALPALGGKPINHAELARLVAEAATYVPGQSREPFRRLEELVRQSISDKAARNALETGLGQLLAPSSTFEARRFACKQLGIVGGKASLPSLASLLKSDETAGIACLALTTYPPGKADEALRLALTSAPAAARIQIINTLGDRRDSESVKRLVEFAANADRSVAEAAVASLGKIGDEDAWKAISALRKAAVPPLSAALSEATVRCAAGLAASGNRKLATVAYQELLVPSQAAYLRRAALEGLLRLDKDQGEQRIVQVLRSADATLKPVAIAAVRSLRSKQASEKFAAELPRLPAQEQVWMIESLAVRGDPAARAAIAKSLRAPDADVRRAASASLSRVGDVSSVPLLARALADANDPDERRAIESALIALAGGVPVDRAILGELHQSTSQARVCLIVVLARRQGPAANAVLFEEAGQAESIVAQAAFRALGKTAAASDLPAILKKLVEARDPEVRGEAASAAAQTILKVEDAPSRSAAVLDALRRAQTAESLTSLLALLPRCGDAQALSVLKAAQTDPDARVRDTAVRALADWPDAAAWDILAGIYRQGASEGVRGLALRGLVRLAGEENAHPDARLMDRYRQLLADAHGDTDLRLILGTLAATAHPDALQLAVPLLAHATVRPEAEVAVKRIAESIKAQHPQAAQEALQKIQAKP